MAGAFVADYGVYIPRGRVSGDILKSLYGKSPAGVKGIAMAEMDEDSLTMAYEAAKGIVERNRVGGVILACNSLPFTHKKGSSLLGKMLRLDSSLPCWDLAGGPLAAAEALSLAVNLVEGGSSEGILVVCAEHPRYRPGEEVEMAWGAGAAAFMVAPRGFARVEDIVADYEIESYDLWSLRGEEVLRYRPEMLDDNFDRALSRLLTTRGGTENLGGYRYVPLQLNRFRWTRVLARRGIKNDQWEPVNSLSAVGNLGSATFAVNLAMAFEQAAEGDRILAVGYGHGNTVSVSLSLTADPPPCGVREKMAAAMPVDLATYWKTIFQRRFGA
ncbi:3-hydroxy-3-methylglutaryl CoA synthase [Desulfofundulus luciae]|uniref:3-hydroxy-3-methylglutaryl CoA synthase n=1 Tax=Desulfofundulus luciae TaxID=74702 RepID=A0ABU0B2S3_9FIRM|nr:3-oxoacyl-[acyl-carrier-protein] synthase III C-terminal domain-containing protein [Desulfofundulus luciae]MDQ0287030.1 3-hydroxy-3-methylglutaryl CoA synthase [Desulfofundulus luciae]